MVMAHDMDVYYGRKSTTFLTALNAFFTANSGNIIRSFSFVARDVISSNGTEYMVGVGHETGGSQQGAAYVAELVSGDVAKDLDTAVDAIIAANPTYFFVGPFVDMLGQRRRRYPYQGLVVSCSDQANASSNWQA